ncbi:M23 family metallopeptidase [Clostridium thermosuccinogenes]|uniref:M23 family metallopeptidase n=1 Tax=Clostridium thermosuccinogenes TaxID=84032 RepID=UPI000CCC9304|nr:M23 family metallopeptidase [Pseudoclostridium thermosuccinogenes]PNT94298.1 hypothetical protein CDQ83_12725 [Pseudoclostridium thermosuccinogenes]
MSTIKSNCTAYYGPHEARYVAAESLATGTVVTALSKETYATSKGSEVWVFIEWGSAGSKKRGYVKSDWLNITENISTKSPYTESGTGARWVKLNISPTVYRGSDSVSTTTNTQYSSAGSLNAKEQVTYLNEKVNNWALIEYSTSNGKMKRAYVNADNLTGTISSISIASPGIAYTVRDRTIPGHLPYGGGSLNQGFNDTNTTIYKGHLGYDIGTPNDFIKPLFEGTYVSSKTSNSGGNGRTITLKHVVNNETFFTTYCHMASVESFTNGQKVFPTTILGMMGGSGNGKDDYYNPHLHLALYTGKAQDSPYGYCDETAKKTFAEVVVSPGSTEGYYYGADTTYYPRCGGVRFYDPYRVYTSGAAIITAMKNKT